MPLPTIPMPTDAALYADLTLDAELTALDLMLGRQPAPKDDLERLQRRLYARAMIAINQGTAPKA